MVFEAHVTFTDGEDVQNVRGYQDTNWSVPGIVQFIFEDELLTFPLHRVKEISEISLKEPLTDGT